MWKRFWPILAIVIVTGGDVLLNLPSYDLPFGVWFAIGMLVVQIVLLAIPPKPKIELTRIYPFTLNLHDQELGKKDNGFYSKTELYIILELRNNPRMGRVSGANANSAYARINLFKKDGTQIFKEYIGVWALDCKPPALGDRFSEKNELDSSGYPEYLILAKHRIEVEKKQDETKQKIEISPVERLNIDKQLSFRMGAKVFRDEEVYYRIQIFANNYEGKSEWAMIRRTDEHLSWRANIRPPFKVKDK